MNISKKFGESLRALRNDKSMTQATLAKYLGTDCNMISRWENGKSEPSLLRLRKLAEIFDTTCDDLLSEEVMDSNILADKLRTQNNQQFLDEAAARKISTQGFTAAFRERVESLCKTHNMTIEALKAASGVTNHMTKLFNGAVSDARISTIRKIAKVFNLTLAEFFDTPLFDQLDK